jgi:very-short-patch-repair endonuclease
MSELFICDICQKEFKSKRSLSSHKNHHNPEYKKKALEGSKSLLSEKSITSRKNYYDNKRKASWAKRNSVCIICGKQLEYPQEKTCSNECYKQYRVKANSRPMTEEKMKAIKKGISEYLEKTGYKKENPIICKVCKKTFQTEGPKKYYCSEDCKNESKIITKKKISKSMKLAFKEGRHLGNEYRNRKNKSYLERSFINYLEIKFPLLEYHFNYVVKILDEHNLYKNCYYIDFYFPKQNIGIELDGKQHKSSIDYDNQRDQLIYQTQQTKIIRVAYDEFFSKERKEEIDNILINEL